MANVSNFTSSTNVTITEAPETVTQDPAINKQVVVTIYLFLCISGLIFNCLYWFTYVYSKALKSSAFFSLAASLSVADSLQLSVCGFYGTVSSYLGYNIAGQYASSVVGAFSNLAWFCGTPTLFMQAVNRLIAIRYPTQLLTVYTRRNTIICVIIPWCISIVNTLPNFFPCCYQLWYWEGYSTGYNLPVFGSVVYSYFDVSFTISIIIVVFIIHLIIFISLIRRKKVIGTSFGINISAAKAEQKRRQETAQFVQFFVITTLPVITSIVSNLIPIFEVNPTVNGVVGMTLSLVYEAANGWIYMLFNQTVKEEFRAAVFQLLKTVGVTNVTFLESGTIGTEMSDLPKGHAPPSRH